MQIKPLLDRVLIRPLDPEAKSPGGIIIPDTVKAELHAVVSGRVLAIGPGARTPTGETIPMTVAKGDIVLYQKYDGHEFTHDGEKLVMVREGSIDAILAEV